MGPKMENETNVNKCKVLHFNKCEDNHYDYYMTDQHTMCQMTSTPEEKDIGSYLIIICSLN